MTIRTSKLAKYLTLLKLRSNNEIQMIFLKTSIQFPSSSLHNKIDAPQFS